MKLSAKTFWKVLIGLAVTLSVLLAVSIVPLRRVDEFMHVDKVEGYWASVQEFVQKNGHYPKDEAELGTFFHETPEEMRKEPVEYVAPRDTNADEVILWDKTKTLRGLRVGITESGIIVKQ